MPNLIEGLQSEMNRVRELMPHYDLPNGAGEFALGQMRLSIERAERSIATGDPIEGLLAYEELQSWQG